MPKLTDTQSVILSRAAPRPGNLAMPLPEGLHGAAAKKVVTMMIERGWLEEVDADLRKGEPLWRETGDGHGVTLVATSSGLTAIGIESEDAAAEPTEEAAPKAHTPREGTKQAMLIALLSRPEGATIDELAAATQWMGHTVRGAMSGALKKKLGLVITSEKEEHRGRVYRFAGL